MLSRKQTLQSLEKLSESQGHIMLPNINPFGTQKIVNFQLQRASNNSMLTTSQNFKKYRDKSQKINDRQMENLVPKRKIKPKTYERILNDKFKQFGKAAVLNQINQSSILRKDKSINQLHKIPVKNSSLLKPANMAAWPQNLGQKKMTSLSPSTNRSTLQTLRHFNESTSIQRPPVKVNDLLTHRNVLQTYQNQSSNGNGVFITGNGLIQPSRVIDGSTMQVPSSVSESAQERLEPMRAHR